MAGWRTWPLALSLLLAGCADAGPPAGPMDDGMTEEAVGSGAIRGIIVDDSLLPVSGVIVTLDIDESTTTGDDGGFFFEPVGAGGHTLDFTREGFEDRRIEVDVVAGHATQVRVTLTPAPSTGSYFSTMTQSGVTFCGVSYKVPVIRPNNTASGNVCVLAAQAGQEDYDRSQIRWFFQFYNSSGFWSETQFTRSSSFNGGMDVLWTLLLDDGASTPSIRGGGGRDAPVQVRVPMERIDEVRTNFTTESCKGGECMLLSYHYVRGETLGPDQPVDGGVGLQQRYDVWVSTFYNGPLPTAFTIFPDQG